MNAYTHSCTHRPCKPTQWNYANGCHMLFRHACNAVNCFWLRQKMHLLHIHFTPHSVVLFIFSSVAVDFLLFLLALTRCSLSFFFFLPLTFLPFISSQHDIQSFLCFIHLSPSVVVFFSSPPCLDTNQRQFDAGGLSFTVILTLW